MSRRKLQRFLASLTIALLVLTTLVSCAAPAQAPAAAPTKSAPAAVPANWATQPMKNPTTVVLSVESGAMEAVMKAFAPDLKSKLNIDLKIVGNPLSDQWEVQYLDLSSGTGQYDVLSYWPMYLADFRDYVSPLKEIAPGGADQVWKDLNMDDHLPGFRWTVEYKGNIMGVQYDGDVKVLHYRHDLAADPKEHEAFKAKYGYDFDVNNLTWEQYLDVAKFFQRPDKNLFGTAEIAGFAASTFFDDRYLGMGGHYFDYNSMKAIPDKDICVKAFKNAVETINKASPPEAHSFEFEDARNQIIVNNRVMFVPQWPDVWKWSGDPKLSKSNGQVWIAVMPGFMKDGKLLQRPALGGGGRILTINKASKNKEAAYKFLVFVANNLTNLVNNNDTWLDASRKSHLDPNLYANLCKTDSANCKSYSEVLTKSVNQGQAFVPIPGVGKYFEAAERWTKKAFAEQVTPEQACDGLAKDFDDITNQVGKDKQLKEWQAHVDTWLKPKNLWP